VGIASQHHVGVTSEHHLGAAPQHHVGVAPERNVGMVAREPHSRPIPATPWGWSPVSRTRAAIPAAPPLPGSLPRANRASRPDGALCPGRRSAAGPDVGVVCRAPHAAHHPCDSGSPRRCGRTAPLTGATERGCAALVVVLAFPARASPVAGVRGSAPRSARTSQAQRPHLKRPCAWAAARALPTGGASDPHPARRPRMFSGTPGVFPGPPRFCRTVRFCGTVRVFRTGARRLLGAPGAQRRLAGDLGPGGDVELLEYVRHVGGDRATGEHQPRGDLRVGEPVLDQRHDLELGIG
jgi:hypothetical protein